MILTYRKTQLSNDSWIAIDRHHSDLNGNKKTVQLESLIWTAAIRDDAGWVLRYLKETSCLKILKESNLNEIIEYIKMGTKRKFENKLWRFPREGIEMGL